MADPISIVAGISSVTSLADVSCSLAGSLYKAFRAIKDAPRAVQRLSKELEELHNSLKDVENLLQRYSTSLLVSEDGLSVKSVQSVLQECQTELGQVQTTAAAFKRQPGKLKNAAARFKWVVDERKIKQHCQTIEQLRQHINTGLSVLSHQYDINARERDKSLHSQVAEVRNVLDTSATETRNLVSSEFGTVRCDIEQVAVKVAHSQEGLQTNIQTSHDHLCQEVSRAGIRTCYGIEGIQNDLRDTNLLEQRNQQHTMQEFLQLKQSVKSIDSMLSQVLLLYSEHEESPLDCSLAQHPRLEGIMFSLLMMKSSLVSAISELKSKSSLDISEEETEFLLSEFENLVAFSHEASALRIRQRCIRAEGEERPPRGCTSHTSMARKYALDVDSLSQPMLTRRERLRRLSHTDASGILKLSFETRAGDVKGRPASVSNASFSYIPNLNFHRTGVYATFRKEMRMGLNPSISRSLRVLRIFPNQNDTTYHQLANVLHADDLHGLQRMLSCGQVRPWDQNWHGWNLLKMAMLYVDHLCSKIIDYLLLNAWDIENSDDLQFVYWQSQFFISGPGGFDPSFQASRRMSALGQDIKANTIHDIITLVDLEDWTEIEDVCKFLINNGANIEYRDSFRRETALLLAAEADDMLISNATLMLLRLGADQSAVDYKRRGPLHLALKPARENVFLGRPLEGLDRRSLKKKLVHLLQAGCPIHTIDDYGRTPTDVARKWRRTKTWEAALREVGKLECGRSECGCEIIKTENSKTCNATLPAFGHGYEENSDEDSDGDVDDSCYLEDSDGDVDDNCYSEDSGVDVDNYRYLEDSESENSENYDPEDFEETRQDGDEYEDPRITTHKDEDGYQAQDMYEADSEGQDSDIDSDEGDHQNINPSENKDATSNLKPGTESLEESALNESNLHNNTPTVPQISKPDPSPTRKPHYDAIALGQHHIWI